MDTQFSAFTEEYVNIKQAAIGTTLGAGMTAIRGLGQVARQGFKNKGLSGAWQGVKGAVQTGAKDPNISKAMLAGAGMIGAGGLGLYGAKKAIVG